VRRIDDAAAIVHKRINRVDADGLEHGNQERGLVFAVAVTVAEDVSCMVRLPAADTRSTIK